MTAGYTPEEERQIAAYVLELEGEGGPMLRRAAARDPATPPLGTRI